MCALQRTTMEIPEEAVKKSLSDWLKLITKICDEIGPGAHVPAGDVRRILEDMAYEADNPALLQGLELVAEMYATRM